MDHITQVAQLHRLLRYRETGTTNMSEALYCNPVADYTGRQQAALESEILFRRHPLLLALSCELPVPGDYVTDNFSGVPILAVRVEGGQINAFVNVCRHRGSRLAQGCGAGRHSFSCPYHGWTYDRSGHLKSIPFEPGFIGLDNASHRLSPLPVVEKFGVVCVLPTAGDELDIDHHLDSMALDVAGFGLETYSHYETRVLRAQLNWELVVDTFLEIYHLNVLHRDTIAPILHGNLSTFDGMGRNLRMIGARRTLDSLATTPEAEWDLLQHSAMVYVIFPNTVFVMQGDHLETRRVYPCDTPDESKMHVSLYTPQAADREKSKRHWDRNMDLLMATVLKEDFPLAENAQRDFHSGAQTHLTFGRNEPALAHFHQAAKVALANVEAAGC